MSMTVERYTPTAECTITVATDPMDHLKSNNGKPMGTWVSVPGDDGGDWPEWCRRNSFQLEKLAYRHTLQLDTDRVLVIDTLAKLDAFNAQLRECDVYLDRGGNLVHNPLPRISDHYIFRVDWRPWVERYAGIVIAPYQWERRCDFMWYSIWDCASGCIWDPSAIAHVSTEQFWTEAAQ